MHFTGAEITAFIGSLLWPFFRIGAMLMSAPITGMQYVPQRIRLGIGIVLTIVVMPSLPPVQPVDVFSLSSLLIIGQQILIGVSMGFALQMVFNAVVTSAQLIAMQMGLGFAAMVDPQNGAQIPVLGQLYVMLTSLVFLAVDGHLILISVVAESFQLMPIGATGIDRDGFKAMADWGSHLFLGALWIALPAVASLLLVNIAFGVMARAAPQLNIFSIGFPVTMMAGFAVILFVLPALVPQLLSLFDQIFELINRLLTGVPSNG